MTMVSIGYLGRYLLESISIRSSKLCAYSARIGEEDNRLPSRRLYRRIFSAAGTPQPTMLLHDADILLMSHVHIHYTWSKVAQGRGEHYHSSSPWQQLASGLIEIY